MKEEFDAERYARLKHRAKKLKERVALDKEGKEKEQIKWLLTKIEKKIEDYEKTHKIPEMDIQNDYSVSSSFDFWKSKKEQQTKRFYEDLRSEEEMAKDLGILYMMFGGTYQTILNYHIYKIHFKKQINKEYAFCRSYADVYEDDNRVCHNIIIGFYPFNFGDTQCGDIGFSSETYDCIKKYNNGCVTIYNRLFEELKEMWNEYFEEQESNHLIGQSIKGYIASKEKNEAIRQLSEEERRKVVELIEEEIESGEYDYLKSCSSKITIMAYRPYCNLISLLEQSGVVYQVDSKNIYLWNGEAYRKMVGYKYKKSQARYFLYVV